MTAEHREPAGRITPAQRNTSAPASAPPQRTTPERRLRLARVILIALGVIVLGVGAVVMFTEVRPAQIVGVGIWIVGAIVIHDAILSPVLLGIDVLMRRAGRRVRLGVVVIIQVGIVVGAVMSLLVIPEVYAKTLGPKNDTVLPLDYGLNLALFWAATAVLTALAAIIYVRLRPRPARPAPAASA